MVCIEHRMIHYDLSINQIIRMGSSNEKTEAGTIDYYCTRFLEASEVFD